MSIGRVAFAWCLCVSVAVGCRVKHVEDDPPPQGADAGLDAGPGDPGRFVDPNPGAPIPDGHPWVVRNTQTDKFLRGVWCSADASLVVAVGYEGTVLRSTDRGATWSTVAIDTKVNLEAAWGSGKDDVYVVGDAGTVLHSTDGAQHFTAKKSGTTRLLFTIWGSGPNNVFIAGQGDATIFRSRDRGNTWWEIRTPALSGIGKIWGIDEKTIYANSAGGVLASHDTGERFGLTITSLSQQNRLWASDPANIYTVNKAGVVTRHDETSGVATKNSPPLPVKSLIDVWGTGANDVYVVGDEGRIAHSSDRGDRWVIQPSGTTAPLYAIHGADGEVFAVGSGGTLVQRSASIGADGGAGDAGAGDASSD